MVKADEVSAAFMTNEDALKDRKLFVHNLGEILSQTREGILGASLDDEEFVTVLYKRGDPIRVNVNMDSYFAIIKDVVKAIDNP